MQVPFIIATLFGVSAALSTARMELPADFQAAATRIELTGFGGHNKGSYRFTDINGTVYSGDFKRGESRLGILDPLLVSNKGKSSFSFTDPASGHVVAASCEFRKFTVNVDIVTLDTKKVAYQCELRNEAARLVGQVVIGQPPRKGMKAKFLANDLRAGEVAVFGHNVLVESVHAYQGSKFGSQPPVGYRLSTGDRPDLTVAAVELTDINPGLYVSPDIEGDERRAVFVAALAVAVFRDPALSALEE